ncbi:hypothetical protein [Oceanobacillus sp. CFH 90083]|uniref:hypothetical protein n=1 Tax=Oceanobacillus sp. CFH 90083 TaxID=2592336 RepID=UPI00128C3224|nr:hypothetical protein [Oceanobacillus sp. CFH 90083]
MSLTNHFLTEDMPQVFEEIKRFSTASVKCFDVVENAQFEMKEAIFTEMSTAYAKLEMLHRKKIDADVSVAANEEIRRNMF